MSHPLGAYKGPLTKPHPLDRLTAKYQRKVERSKAKAAIERAESARQSAIREARFTLDGGRCRAYGVPLKLKTDNPMEKAECHHLVFKSALGHDELCNRITLSPEAHRDIHEHKLTMSGDPDDVVTFTKWNPETGKALESWLSPAPKGREA